MQAQVLPKELRVTAPPTMPQARSYLFKQGSTLSSYNDSTNVIQINLPRLQRSYLTKESYLRFLVNAQFQPGVATTTRGPTRYLAFDQPGAYGLIDKIEIYDYLGSTLLESTSGHGQLMSLLMDLDTSSDEQKNHFNMICGTVGSQTTSTPYSPGVSTSGTLTGTSFVVGTIGASSTVLTVSITGATTLPRNGDTFIFTTFTLNATVYTGAAAGYLISDVVMTSGTAGSFKITYPQVLAAGTSTAVGAGAVLLSTYIPNSFGTGGQLTATGAGELFYAPSQANATDVVTVQKEYTLPLFSFLGSLSDKFAPLHNGYTIMITLNSAANAFGLTTPGVVTDQSTSWNTGGGYNISNIYFEAQILELGPVAESMLLSSTGGQPLIVPTKAFRNYVGSIPQGSSAYRLDLNLNVASLTNLLFIQRLAGDLNSFKYKSLSQRVRNYLQNWYFQYGSSVLPQTSGITCSNSSGGEYGEAYCELMKARHNLLSDNFTTQINRFNFPIDSPGVLTTGTIGTPELARMLDYWAPYETGRFACGIDLELVSGKSSDLICGMNTNGMNTSIFLNFLPGSVGSVANTRLDCWAEYDAFINVSPGLATTVSF